MPSAVPVPSTRKRSKGSLGAAAAFGPPVDEIVFPKFYEDAWGDAATSGRPNARTDLERSVIFLLRMANLEEDQAIAGDIRAILTDQRNCTVIALANAIRHKVFKCRHASFTTSPWMQCVRFMLIKARVMDAMPVSEIVRILDFYFDPTLERNLKPLPLAFEDSVTYPYPSGRLKVVIVGGGPTALASAISLAEKGAGKVEVHMYERRWVQKRSHNGSIYIDYPHTAKRRDQVVTLQDSVTTLLSKPSYQALFAGAPERVWPGSANIQIRKVEDRFLKRVQDPEFRGLIHLHTEGVTQEDIAKVGDFHVLLGADGAASWVRKSYFSEFENERGRSYALGIAFDRPAGLPWSQPLNVFLTLGQTRYLLNASDHDGRGYLNMQLTEEEWHRMLTADGQPVHFGRPGCLRAQDGSIPAGFEEGQVFAPSNDRESPLWVAISDGLKLFGFKESEVINIVRIPIVVQAVEEGVQELPSVDSTVIKRPHALVAVAGDAAMTVHFWPGRGLNSGIKAGIALGDELVHALHHGRFVGMPLDAMQEYNDFIIKLQGREHDKRSIPILNQSGSPEMLGWLLDKANSVPDNVAIEWLIGAMTQIADRLEERDDWAFEPVLNVEPQLRIVLRQLNSMTLKEMAVSFPWPTREMAGAEVLPVRRAMEPEQNQKRLRNLWSLLRDSTGPRRRSASSVSSSRFEAPRSKSPGVPPEARARSRSPRMLADAGLRRSNAHTGRQSRSDSLSVPARTESPVRSRSSSPTSEYCLGRMMTIRQKPPQNVLDDALSVALFQVQGAR